LGYLLSALPAHHTVTQFYDCTRIGWRWKFCCT